jgi:hypothetical protein
MSDWLEGDSTGWSEGYKLVATMFAHQGDTVVQ